MVGKRSHLKPQDIEKAGLCLALLSDAALSVPEAGLEPARP